MAFARLYISKLEGMEFYKLFGTGSKEGFSSNINPFSNSGIYAIMAVWENENQANIALESSKIFQNYIFKSNEHWHIFLRNISVKGKWNGKIPFKKFKDDVEGDLVVLTRATIKPRVLAKFWERVPNIQNVIGNNKDVVFKIGLAEVPFFQSVTFSIWKSVDCNTTYPLAWLTNSSNVGNGLLTIKPLSLISLITSLFFWITSYPI